MPHRRQRTSLPRAVDGIARTLPQTRFGHLMRMSLFADTLTLRNAGSQLVSAVDAVTLIDPVGLAVYHGRLRSEIPDEASDESE